MARAQINQWLPPVIQRRLTEKRVIRAIHKAYRDVPFYRAKFDEAGLDIKAIRTLADLKKLPLLTKDEVRQQYPDGILSRRYADAKLVRSATTGSTGKALGFAFSMPTFAYYLNTSLRVYTMIGYRPWYKAVYIKYTAVEMPSVGPFFRSAHIPSTIGVEEQIVRLRQARPDLLVGYASIITEIARSVSPQDLELIRPRLISVNSELSTPDQRAFIARTFGCPVYDEYSTEETWMIASECSQHKYHLFTDNVWVEFLDSEGREVAPGCEGEMVLTTLNSPAMPFIRYRIGDIGRPGAGKCACGRAFPLLESFEGRADDSFILPSGRYVSSLKILNTFTKAIKHDPHLMEEFRCVQHEPDRIEIEVQPGRDYRPEGFEPLLANLRLLFDEPVAIEVSRHERIATNASIKRKAIVSKVHNTVQPVQSCYHSLEA